MAGSSRYIRSEAAEIERRLRGLEKGRQSGETK
jgi:hypothetical protein